MSASEVLAKPAMSKATNRRRIDNTSKSVCARNCNTFIADRVEEVSFVA